MQIQPSAAAESHGDDVAAITALVAELEKAQQTEQPTAFTALSRPTASGPPLTASG